MSDAVLRTTPARRALDLLRCSHPKQAVAVTALIGTLAALDSRPVREVAAVCAAVLAVQLSLGLSNDLADQDHDYRAQSPGKPLAEGRIAPGNASYWMIALLLAAIPLAAMSGAVAGAALLLTVPVGWVHNRWLHRTSFSWLGWTISAALYPAFLAYGGWAGRMHGSAPTWAVTGAAAAIGLCAHLATSLGDLVEDNKSGARTLPLRLALRWGAPRVLLLTIALSALAASGLVVAGLTAGLRQ